MSLIVVRKNLIEYRLQIVRHRAFEFHPASIGRVMEHEPEGVQKGPLESEHGSKRSGHSSSHASVHRIADNWMPDFAEVHANLMRPSGCDRHMNERDARKMEGLGDA